MRHKFGVKYMAAAVMLLAAMLGGCAKQSTQEPAEQTAESEAQEETLEAEEKNTLEENSHASVERLIDKYLDCLANGDLDGLAEVQDEVSEDEKNGILIRSRAIDGYENVNCYTMNGPEEDSFIVFVTYDMALSPTYVGSTDTRVPGVYCLYVSPKDEDGGRYIHGNADQDTELAAYVSELEKDPDVTALLEDVKTRYQEAVESDEGLRAFLESIHEKTSGSDEEETAFEETDSVETAAGEEPSEETAEEAAESQETDTGEAAAQNRETRVTESVNVRAEATTDSERLALAYQGDPITQIESYDNGWSKVEYKGKTGYVKTEFLE